MTLAAYLAELHDACSGILERGRVDAVIAGLLFMAGMRRSEVSALRCAGVADSTAGDGILVATSIANSPLREARRAQHPLRDTLARRTNARHVSVTASQPAPG